MENKTPINVHSNHRNRVKNRFRESGLSGFADHEVLEFLLFYSIPQADTNITAHNLLNTFGSLNRVFEADIKDLVKVPGVGENSATLIKLAYSIIRRFNLGDPSRRTPIHNQVDAIKYISNFIKDAPKEVFLVVCLDNQNCVIDTKELSSGTESKVTVSIRQLTEYVIRNNCEKIIIAHNHPVGDSEPSHEDVLMTQRLFNSCVLNDIDILDHIIYSPKGYYTFAESGVLLLIKRAIVEMLKFVIDKHRYEKFKKPSPDYEIIPRDKSIINP